MTGYVHFVATWALYGLGIWIVWIIGLGIWIALMDADDWRSMWLWMLAIIVGMMGFIGTCVYVGERTALGDWGAAAIASIPFVAMWFIGKRSRARLHVPAKSSAVTSSSDFQAHANDLAQELCDNLNRSVMESIARRAPGADWTEWRLGDKVFRISPDGKEARELQPDGTWDYKVADYVRRHARRP